VFRTIVIVGAVDEDFKCSMIQFTAPLSFIFENTAQCHRGERHERPTSFVDMPSGSSLSPPMQLYLRSNPHYAVRGHPPRSKPSRTENDKLGVRIRERIFQNHRERQPDAGHICVVVRVCITCAGLGWGEEVVQINLFGGRPS